MAPRKRGGRGNGGLSSSSFFCCFNGSDQPEITYRLREDFAPQAMEPALPMPAYDELDGIFSELVVRSEPARHLLGTVPRREERLLPRRTRLVSSVLPPPPPSGHLLAALMSAGHFSARMTGLIQRRSAAVR